VFSRFTVLPACVSRRTVRDLIVAAVVLAAGSACTPGRDEGAAPPASVDVARSDTARAVALDDFGAPIPSDAQFAERVVSLSPALTEVAFAIGAGARLVGRTSWDDRPAAARAVTDVGPGMRPNVEAVLATRPTLVLLYASPDNRAAADALARAGVRVIALRTVTIADFRRSAHVLGRVLGSERDASVLVDSIDATLNAVREAVRDVRRPRVVWPSWDAPVMVVGNGSYEAELLDIAGATNVFADRAEPVATVTLEEIAARNPDLLLAGPDRVKRLRESTPWQAVRAVRDGRLVVLDTAVIGRPGVAIGMSAVALARALHPDRASALP
jgi:iron complex transport system substrate-binding protein